MKRLLPVILALCAGAALALDPAMQLDDPELEARARALDFEIRCVQCQSEAVASSNAAWAEDAKRIIRERILAGDTDREVKAFFVERYGEVVLMDPPKTGSSLLLWLAGPIMLLLGALVGWRFVRSSETRETQAAALSDAEQARLNELLKSQD